MCSPVLFNKSFWIYKNKAVDHEKSYLFSQCVMFAIKALILAIRNRNLNNNNPMSASIYSVDNLCKRFRQNKHQQIISLICPYMNSNHLFFDA